MNPRIASLIAAATLVFTACGRPEPTGLGPIVADIDRVVVVSPSSATLDIGGTQQFSAQLIQGGVQKKAAFIWSSSDPSVATVSSSGMVTGVGAGQATITASASRT